MGRLLQDVLLRFFFGSVQELQQFPFHIQFRYPEPARVMRYDLIEKKSDFADQERRTACTGTSMVMLCSVQSRQIFLGEMYEVDGVFA